MGDARIPIGIDLGTVNSVLAIHREHKTEIIQCQDLKITPSWVFFDPDNEDEVIVGDFETEAALACPSNAIYDAKRLIGRSYDDDWIKNCREEYVFKIVPSPNNGILLEIRQNGKTVHKTPQEVSAEILKVFKNSATKYLGYEVKEAVITVPAYFNISQRNATKKAANLAGLNVLMLLNEPTAAALHYISERVKNDSLCLVFDLGGGTFDISIVKFSKDGLKTIAVDGDTFLGGRNIDEAIYNYFVDLHKLKLNKSDRRRLLTASEEIKRKISYKSSHSKTIMSLGKSRDFDLKLKLTKEQFEKICVDIFNKCLKITDHCLKNAGLKKNDIEKIILVGGSTKIPKVQEMVSEFFNNKKILTDVDPDEAVAAGAAIQAASMKGLTTEKFRVVDVNPFSIGTAVYGGIMSVFIKRNSPIPIKYSKNLLTSNNNQETLSVIVYEGERLQCKQNNLLGKFTVKNLPKRPAGEVKVEVTFSIDKSGLLTVSAKEENADEYTKLEVGVEFLDLKSKSTIPSAKDLEEDKQFEKFINTKCNIRSKCLKYISNKSGDPNVKICNAFINSLDKLDFEKRTDLQKLVNIFKNEIKDNDLIIDISFELLQ